METKLLEEYNAINAKQEAKEANKNKSLRDNMQIAMIVILAIMQVVLSCLTGVDGGLGFIFPTTAWGWVTLIAPKLAISFVGYLLWLQFFDKGKAMAKVTEEYKRAEDIFTRIQGRSPQNIMQAVNPSVWEVKTKTFKGIKMIITLALTSFIVAELVVNFSVASLLASILSLLISIFYGFQMMNTAEEMFSTGYLRYALVVEAQFNAKQAEEARAKETVEPQETTVTSEEINNDNNRQQNLS